MPATGSDGSARLRVLFMGTPALAVPSLEALHAAHDVVAVVTQPDRRSGRGRQTTGSPVKDCALRREIPVMQPDSLRSREVVERLAGQGADVFVVVAFGQLLPATVLALPRLGCVNLHASLLPRHRGASPIQAAILAGDTTTGNTTMLMDEGLDTGPMLLSEPVEIRADDTAGTLGEGLGRAGGPLMLATLHGLARGSLEPRPQPTEGVTMTRKIRKQDGLIDWSDPAARIERLVRAMQPWPSAATGFAGQRLQLWAADVGPGTDLPPGTVVSSSDHALVVACGDGASLVARELQRPGGRRLPAADLLRGFPIPAGSLLGADA